MKKREDRILLPQKKADRVQEIFLQEIESWMQLGNTSLERLVRDEDPEAFFGLYEFAHTLKGSAEMVGLRTIIVPAEEILTALTLVKQYNVELSYGLQSFLRDRIEEIHKQIEAYQRRRKSFHVKETGARKKRQVLVVDYDPTLSNIIRLALEERGFKVLSSNNLQEAELILINERPDLLVLDTTFPQEGGIKFCQKVRSIQKFIPIILLSPKNRLQDRLSGFACGADDYISKPFDMEELIARINAILSRDGKYEHLVMKDELTGIFNRRYLSQRLNDEVNLAKRKKDFVSLVMVDLDRFKDINDCYGHWIGDSVLQYFVERIQQNLRDSDVICRCGGDEFVIIMPNTARTEAMSVMERIKTALQAEPYEEGKTKIFLPFSAGVASYPEDGESAQDLLLAADTAMYQAKESGRNRVLEVRSGAVTQLGNIKCLEFRKR